MSENKARRDMTHIGLKINHSEHLNFREAKIII